jgi:hypothetical protein
MTRFLFAAAAALALSFALPTYAGCPNCADCPEHKDKVAAAEKKEGGEKVACPCKAETKGECKCGANSGCHCPHCHSVKESKKT